MGDSRVFTQPLLASHRPSAGIILRIRLENFMCHSSLQIEFGEWLNFITGQNGSNSLFSLYLYVIVLYALLSTRLLDFLIFAGGKSAILTALCVAFGSRAKETQRATTLKEFIKTGCRFVVLAFVCVHLVVVEGRGVMERVIFIFIIYYYF